MFYLSIPLSALELIVLLIVAAITMVVIRFFIISQRNLKQALQKTNQVYFQKGATPAPAAKNVAEIIKEQLNKMRPAKPAAVAAVGVDAPVTARKKVATPEESVESVDGLKQTIMQQQRLLSGFLKQVEEIESEGKEELQMENRLLQKEIKSLEAELEEKELELEELKKKTSLTDRMNDRIEEVYAELEQLQEKMVLLEKQAGRANNLAIELEETRNAYEQIHKELQRKNDKLQDVFSDNERLNQEMLVMEEKLAEANLQRQQLQRKTQFLQDLNTDLQTVSDTNKKLHGELRRISELESMLSMIAEERDFLLQKQQVK